MTCYCVNTLALLGTTAIPPGTESVVVEQFNTSSAVSAALYIPVASDPGHALAVANVLTTPPQWWAIHPDHVTLEAAGAPPSTTGDCAPAMANVLGYLAAVTRAKLQLWERDYVLQSCKTLNQSDPSTDPLLYFSIIGRGRGVSRLLIPWATEGALLGAFAITFSSNQSEFMARDFSVIATGAMGTNAGCGTAILVNFPGSGSAPGHHRGAILAHIEVGNDNVEIDNVSWSYFNVGIDLSGAPHPLVFDVTIAGPGGNPPDVEGCNGHCFPDEAPQYLPQIALRLDESYGAYISDCKFWHGQVGISYNNTAEDAAPQGFSMFRCELSGFKTAFYFRHLAADPSGFIGNCFVSFRDVGFDIWNIYKWQITGCEFFNNGDGYNVGGDGNNGTAYDMSFESADIVNITNCRFNNPAGTNRVDIVLGPSTPSTGLNQHFLIAHNQFGDAGVTTFGISAVQILGDAADIQIGHNDYVGTYSGPIVDDQTGTGAAVAMLGYPTSGTAPVGAVIPNGDPMTDVLPTLGSASVAWPQSYSQAHYLQQPALAPPFPGMWIGWVIYTDSMGRLVAYKGSGMPTVLAS